MKKRMVSLVLVCALLLGLCGSAAAKDVKTQILTQLDISGERYYASTETRALFAVLLLAEFYEDSGSRGGNGITDDYDFTSVYLQKWSEASLYLYVMPTDGTGYYELNYYHTEGSTYYSVTSEFKSGWTSSTVTSNLDYQAKPYTHITLEELAEGASNLSEILGN